MVAVAVAAAVALALAVAVAVAIAVALAVAVAAAIAVAVGGALPSSGPVVAVAVFNARRLYKEGVNVHSKLGKLGEARTEGEGSDPHVARETSHPEAGAGGA